MLLQTVVVLAVAASTPTAVVLPVDLGGAYLKRAEVLQPAVKAGLVEGGVQLAPLAQLTTALGDTEARKLLNCESPSKKCVTELVRALASAGFEPTVVVRSQVSREPSARGVLVQAYTAPEGRLVSTFFEGGLEGEEVLAKVLTQAARQLAIDIRLLNGGAESTAPVHANRSDPLVRRVGWGFLAATGVAAVFGTASAIRRVALLGEPLAENPNTVAQDRHDTYVAAEELRVSAVAGFIVSGVALIPAAIFLYLGFKENPVTFDVIPGAMGPSLSVTATF